MEHNNTLEIFEAIEDNPLETDNRLRQAKEYLWEIFCDNREKIMDMLNIP